MSGRTRLLIVDDERIVRELLELLLIDAGYNCTTAASGLEAIEKLEENEFDLMITDITMPGMNGVELIKRASKLRPEMAMMVVSATTDINTAVDAINAGAQDYVVKPFDPSRLYLTVERVLELRRLKMENIRYQEHLEEMVEQRTNHVRQLFLNSTTALVQALEEKDSYTKGHSSRVARISTVIAREMGLTDDDIAQLDLAGQLHDIGKIGIPDSILLKPSRLTDEEYDVIKSHPRRSYRILQPLFEFRGSLDEITMDENGRAKEETLDAILHHHERIDGRGYPDGLSGDYIPLKARILTVADAYEAMTSKRAYRKPMPPDVAIDEIKRCIGTQFDPEVAEAFIKSYSKGLINGDE